MKKLRINGRWILLLGLLFTQQLQAQHTTELPHSFYTLVFDTVLKSPLISWYIQTTAHATSSVKIERKKVGAFHQDPLIDPGWQVASNKEYRDNGVYDKGHLSPYSAFNFDLNAAKESMYYTNTAPQYSYFNEHAWQKLEQYILKKLAPQHDSIYVYTGCLYGNEKMRDVPVPDYFWKVIVYDHGTAMDAWMARNELTDSTDYESYRIPVEQLRQFIKLYYPEISLLF